MGERSDDATRIAVVFLRLLYQPFQQLEVQRDAILKFALLGRLSCKPRFIASQATGRNSLADHANGPWRDRRCRKDLIVQTTVVHGWAEQIANVAPGHDIHPAATIWVPHNQFDLAAPPGPCPGTAQSRGGERDCHPPFEEGCWIERLGRRQLQFTGAIRHGLLVSIRKVLELDQALTERSCGGSHGLFA